MTASIGEADLGVGEDCAIGHDPDVAHDGQVEAGAEGVTVDSGDERLGEADDGPMEPARRLVHALEGACVVGTQLIAVEAGAEAAANASDYGDGDGVVGGDVLEHGADAVEGLDVEGVATLEPVERQLGDVQRLRSLLTGVSVEAGTVLVREGEIGHDFLIIESGTAMVERDGLVVAEIGPGDFQGEISLLDGGVRTATVTATSPMTLLVATHGEFNSLLDRAPMVARQMLPALVARLRALADSPHTD